MRRFFAFGVAWLAAAVVATVVAWQGVGLIGDQVTDRPSATLSASEIDKALSSTTSQRPSTSRSSTPTRPATTAGASAGTVALPPSATVGGGTAAGGGASPTPGTQGTAGPAGTPPAAAGQPATGAAVQPILRTYRMTGGTTTISFTPQAVRMVSATPNPGYGLSRSEPGDNNGWRVEFEGDQGRSRVDAWWAGGPQRRIREDPADGGGGSGKGAASLDATQPDDG